jgi:hypothetical protein
MGLWAAAKMPSFDAPRKPLPLRLADEVDFLADRKYLADVNRLTDRKISRSERAHLTEVTEEVEAILLQMTAARFLEFAFGDLVETDLDSFIPVGRRSLDLCDSTRPDFDRGYTRNETVLVDVLRHPELFPEHSSQHEQASLMT